MDKKTTSMIGFRCPDELKYKLEKQAESEGRSVSNLIIRILTKKIKEPTK